MLRLSAQEDPRTLDPAIGYDSVSWSFELMVFNMLVDYDAGTNIVPELAQSWEESPDGRRFIFRLRRGVRFSTGREVTSADVKYSLERLLAPKTHSQGAEFFRDVIGAAEFVAGKTSEVSGITTPTPDVVEVALQGPDALFLHKMALPFAAVVDREAADREGVESFGRHPVGTGPLMLDEWVYGQRLRLKRNPHYFRKGLPHLDGVEVVIGASDQLAWFKYQRGELDLAGIPSAEFSRVMADARYRPLIMQRTTLRTHYLGLNCKVAPFDQVAVRQAINLAVNTERLLELIDRRGVVARTILPPDMPGWDVTTPTYAYDPTAARARLAAAGLGGGFETTMWSVRDDTAMRIAQSIQQDLRAVSVDLRIKPVDFPALLFAIRTPKHVPIFFMGWEADFPDASNFLTVLLHSRSRDTNNNTYYTNPEVDRLLDQADQSLDPTGRLRLFHAAEVRIMQDAPWVPVYHPVSFAMRHPRLRGYQLHPLRPGRIEEAWLAW
jgi:peptide/nickel transport system substrate-binding protein/oligopeptide transport system substrate-binding protein